MTTKNPMKANWILKPKGKNEPFRFSKKNPLGFRKQTIYVGKHPYEDADDGELECTESMIDHWVESVNTMLSEGIKIPLPISHSMRSEDNRGWITGAEKANDLKGRISLYLKGEARDDDAKATLKANDISLYSPERKKIAGKVRERPITHAMITSYPVIKGLEGYELACSYDDPMECPECAKRKQANVFQLDESERIDAAGKKMAAKHGKAFAAKKNGLVLVCSEVPDDYEAYFKWI